MTVKKVNQWLEVTTYAACITRDSMLLIEVPHLAKQVVKTDICELCLVAQP